MESEKDGLKIRAEHRVFGDCFEIHGFHGRGVAKPLTIETVEQSLITKPMCVIDYASAQQLMDDLYRFGVRPTEGRDSVGRAQATEKHLDDMRAIVSNKLKVTL